MVPDVLPVITAAGLSGVVQRRVRKLPARVVVYLLLAPALFEPAPGVPILGAALLLSGALAALAAGLGTAGTVALLTVAGAACALLDVAGRSLLRRSIPAQALGQVFGLLGGHPGKVTRGRHSGTNGPGNSLSAQGKVRCRLGDTKGDRCQPECCPSPPPAARRAEGPSRR